MSEVLSDIQSERLEIAVQVTPEVRLAIAGSGALAVAQSYDIDCVEVAQCLADERKGWAKRIDNLENMKKDLFAPAKKAVEDMRARLSKWFDAPLADLNAARDLAGQKLLDWDQAEKTRIAREQAEREAFARKLRQEAEAKAAAERARAEEQAREARRKAAEAEDARRKAEAEGNARAAAAAAAAAAKANEQADAAIENGEARAQEAQLQAAAQVAAVPVEEAVKIAGQAVKENWVRELKPGLTEDDAKALIAAATSVQPELLGLLKLDTGAIDKMAKALKRAMRVPGFVAVNRPLLAGSRK